MGGGLSIIGLLIGVFCNNSLSRKRIAEERNYLERRELYLRIITVLAEAAVKKESTVEDWTVVELWSKIVAPVEVQECLKEIVATNNGHPGRDDVINKLHNTMKKDLAAKSYKSKNKFFSLFTYRLNKS